LKETAKDPFFLFPFFFFLFSFFFFFFFFFSNRKNNETKTQLRRKKEKKSDQVFLLQILHHNILESRRELLEGAVETKKMNISLFNEFHQTILDVGRVPG